MVKAPQKWVISIAFLLLVCAAACNSTTQPTTAKKETSPETITVNGKTYKVADIYNMKEEQLKAFMRDVLDDKMPDDYPVPEYIQNATSKTEMYNTFYERYPYFAFQQDAALRTEVSFRPQMFVDMIRENKALRNKITELETTKPDSTANQK